VHVGLVVIKFATTACQILVVCSVAGCRLLRGFRFRAAGDPCKHGVPVSPLSSGCKEDRSDHVAVL
jgi:hypothetical protein